MSLGGGGSAPTPNASQVSGEQAAANADTARLQAQLNRVNQQTPWGSVTYSQELTPAQQQAQEQYQQQLQQYNNVTLPQWQQAQSGRRQVGIGNDGQPVYEGADPGPMPQAPTAPEIANDQWTQTVTLSPEQQAMLEQQNQLSSSLLGLAQGQLGRIGNSVSQPFSLGGFPAQVSNVGQTIGGQGGKGLPQQQSTMPDRITPEMMNSGTPNSPVGRQFWELSGNSTPPANMGTGVGGILGAQTAAPAAYSQGSAVQALDALSPQLQNNPNAAQVQAKFFADQDPRGLADILSSSTPLGGMALGNIGNALQTKYGTGSGNAVSGLQELSARLQNAPAGTDVAGEQRAFINSLSGGDLADILRSPQAGQFGQGIRSIIGTRINDLAAAADRPDQGAGQIQRQIPTQSLPQMPSIAPMLQSLAGGTGGVTQEQDPYQTALQRQRVEDALYERASARLDPQFEQAQSSLHNSLVNQGIFPGQPAYSKAMEDFGRTKNDAYSSAVNDAILAGGGEQSRLFGLGLAGRQQGFDEALASGNFANQAQQQAYGQASNTRSQLFNEQMQSGQIGFNQALANANLQNQARATAIQEALLQRSLPLNELAAFMGSSQGVTAPQYAAPAQVGVSPVDVSGNYWNSYTAQQNAQNARNAQSGQMMSSLFGLGGQIGAAAIMSDREIKRDIRPIDPVKVLHDVVSLDVPAWKYKTVFDQSAREHIGPMAQDFAERWGGNPQMIQSHDAIGVLFAAVKGLAIQQQEILSELRELRHGRD
ncbi:tail fiber domain-containing protein [Marinibaculum pumilum]|uniref:Tail fiber domain-containing protein n=1 Tax=Marinibaculum pumilum TaxID=1766165 RepID=A0ABV7L2G4_9PROT